MGQSFDDSATQLLSPDYYPSLLSVLFPCLLANLGDKSVSIQDFKVLRGRHYGERIEYFYHLRSFHGIFSNENTSMELPMLLEQGEQKAFVIKVGWMLNVERSSFIGSRVRDDTEALSYGDLLLVTKDSPLFQDVLSSGQEALRLLVLAADGTEEYVTMFIA